MLERITLRHDKMRELRFNGTRLMNQFHHSSINAKAKGNTSNTKWIVYIFLLVFLVVEFIATEHNSATEDN